MGEETAKPLDSRAGVGSPARRILEGIHQVDWESIWLTYEGSAYPCLKAPEPELTLPHLMGICGGAFRFFWHRAAGPGLCNLLLLGERAVTRTFAPLGYSHTYLISGGGPEEPGAWGRYQRLIVQSIDEGRPVIGLGVIGPPGTADPEACVITGYDRGGGSALWPQLLPALRG